MGRCSSARVPRAAHGCSDLRGVVCCVCESESVFVCVCVCVCVDFNRQNLREATGVCPDVGAYRDLCRAAGIARHIRVAQAKVCCTL